jgi:hypothetical protein
LQQLALNELVLGELDFRDTFSQFYELIASKEADDVRCNISFSDSSSPEDFEVVRMLSFGISPPSLGKVPSSDSFEA